MTFLLLAAMNEQVVTQLITSLNKEFALKDLGEINYLTGIEVLIKFVNICKLHWKVVKRILRYLKGTLHHGLHLRKSYYTLVLEAFCDADLDE